MELEQLKKKYESARMSHTNKFTKKSDSLRSYSNESAYRDSANNLKLAYQTYADAHLEETGDPLPVWF